MFELGECSTYCLCDAKIPPIKLLLGTILKNINCIYCIMADNGDVRSIPAHACYALGAISVTAADQSVINTKGRESFRDKSYRHCQGIYVHETLTVTCCPRGRICIT